MASWQHGRGIHQRYSRTDTVGLDGSDNDILSKTALGALRLRYGGPEVPSRKLVTARCSAKRGIAIACRRLSVRLSVRPSVCNIGEL